MSVFVRRKSENESFKIIIELSQGIQGFDGYQSPSVYLSERDILHGSLNFMPTILSQLMKMSVLVMCVVLLTQYPP